MRVVYILDVTELKNSARQEELLAGLNLERRKKVLKCVRPQDQLRSLGAGLLLQYGIWRAIKESAVLQKPEEILSDCAWISVSLAQLECTAGQAAQFCADLDWTQNAHGKPYLKNIPIYFNLSHSASKVLCGVSDSEIGVDIQEMRNGNVKGIWKRFFDEREKLLLEQCDDLKSQEQLFYQMWAYKEAYGKFTGRGLMIDKSPWLDEQQLGICFSQYGELKGYAAVACYKKISATGKERER